MPPLDHADTEPTVALEPPAQTPASSGAGRPEPSGSDALSARTGSQASAKSGGRAGSRRRAPAGAPAAEQRPAKGTGSRAVARTAAASGAVLHRAVRANLTARALALVVVVLVLTISYATSLRIYFAQAHEIASTKAEIADRQATIADLQSQISRWQDPAFVTTQARERLGWVVPGETGYTVVGSDGKPLGGGMTLDSSTGDEPQPEQKMWWDRMWGSVKAADKPAPKTIDPAKRPPITAQTKPR